MGIRVFWWLLTLYDYEKDSTSDDVLKMFNRFALLASYLSLSFFVQTWLKLVIVLNRLPNERALRIFFYCLDSVISAFFVAAIVTQQLCSTGSRVYSSLNIAMGCVNALIAIIFVVVGAITISSLRRYQPSCSRFAA